MSRHNLLSDIAGIRIGHTQDIQQRTGVTAILFDRPAIAASSLLGGAPATRETALLAPEMMVERIDAIVLSGGSTYGLDATTGVQAWLRERAKPAPAGKVRVPIVVQASVFDLANGGDKDWGRYAPYRDMGYTAAEQARSGAFALGTIGGGTGATTAVLRGGLGAASTVTAAGHVVAALVIVNAVGTATIGDTPYFWAAPFEQNGEFGGLGMPQKMPPDALELRMKPNYVAGTTIGVVATNATLTTVQASRLAIMGQDGVTRAVFPAHLPQDGDAIFAVSTEEVPAPASMDEWTEILHAASLVTARAVARGVYEAGSMEGQHAFPTWHERFGCGVQ